MEWANDEWDWSNERLASCRQSYRDDDTAAGVEESAGFGAVELRRSQIGLFRQIVNCIDESGRLAPESRGVGNDVRGSRSTLEQVRSIIGNDSAVSQVLRSRYDDPEKK